MQGDDPDAVITPTALDDPARLAFFVDLARARAGHPYGAPRDG